MMLSKMSLPLSEVKTGKGEEEEELRMSGSAHIALPGDFMGRRRTVHLVDNSVYVGSLPENAEPPEAVFVLDGSTVARSGRTVTLTPGGSSAVTMKFENEVEAMNWLRALSAAISSHETLQAHADAGFANLRVMSEEYSPRSRGSSPRSKRGGSPSTARLPSGGKASTEADERSKNQERALLEERLAAMTQKESQANMVAQQADEQLKRLREQLAKAEAHGRVLQEREADARSAAKTTDQELQKMRDQFEASEAQRRAISEKTENQMMTLRSQLSNGRRSLEEMESKAALNARQSDEQVAALHKQLALAEKERQCLQEQDSTRLANITKGEVQVASLHKKLATAESLANERIAALENDKQSSLSARKAVEEQLAAVRKELESLQSPPPSPRGPKDSRTRSMSPRRVLEIVSDPIHEIPDSWNSSSTLGKITVVSSALALGAVLVQASHR